MKHVKQPCDERSSPVASYPDLDTHGHANGDDCKNHTLSSSTFNIEVLPPPRKC